MSLEKMLRATYGVKTILRVNPLGRDVAITPTRILDYNPNRLGVTIINTGAFPVTINPLNSVAADDGIILSAGGGGVSLVWDRDFELISGEWFAIANGGASTVYVLTSEGQ